MASQFPDIVKLFWRYLFLLSSLVTGPSFMSISTLVLELRQFSFISDWPEIRKSETPTSEFFPIPEEWGKLWIPRLARMSLIECYWMLQNSRVTAVTVSELSRKNQEVVKITSSSTLIRVKHCNFIIKKLQHSGFPVKFTKFLRAPFFTAHIRWKLLKVLLLYHLRFQN